LGVRPNFGGPDPRPPSGCAHADILHSDPTLLLFLEDREIVYARFLRYWIEPIGSYLSAAWSEMDLERDQLY